jgi:hypothetical protein
VCARDKGPVAGIESWKRPSLDDTTRIIHLA